VSDFFAIVRVIQEPPTWHIFRRPSPRIMPVDAALRYECCVICGVSESAAGSESKRRLGNWLLRSKECGLIELGLRQRVKSTVWKKTYAPRLYYTGQPLSTD
jgi:hypothetical protein